MSDLRIGAGVFFERGIDKITFKSGELTQGLPDPRELTPTDNTQRPQLDSLLARPNTDSFLEESIRPNLEDRDLLMPTRFRQAMEGALETLRDAAQERQQAGNPESARELNRAVRLLTEEVGLRDLLQMYRSALYQG
jgi:type III secretion protein X